MRKADLLQRLIDALPIIHRAGVAREATQTVLDHINHLDGPGVSKRVKWFRALEAACIEESHYYRDLSPATWENLRHVSPGCHELRKLAKLRTAIKRAWKA